MSAVERGRTRSPLPKLEPVRQSADTPCAAIPRHARNMLCQRERGHPGRHTFEGRFDGVHYSLSWES